MPTWPRFETHAWDGPLDLLRKQPVDLVSQVEGKRAIAKMLSACVPASSRKQQMQRAGVDRICT